MKIKSCILFALLSIYAIQGVLGQGFNLTENRQDFTPVETFYEIADSISMQGVASASLWNTYFSIPVIQLFRHNPNFDSSQFVMDVQSIFSEDEVNSSIKPTTQQKLLLAYKKNEQKIKACIAQMRTENIDDSIKVLLFPFLKESLRKDSILPKQLYMVLDEGNGGLPGYVFNSMLQTAKLNNFGVGLISAHESIHSIVGSIFNDNFNKYKHLNDFQKSFLYFMEIIAEEGVADLIDKPILGQIKSPLYAEVARLTHKEEFYAKRSLRKIDSLIVKCSNNGHIAFTFRAYSKNGGHIPGRFMARKIKEAGLLSACIDQEGSPFGFFELFQNAEIKLGITPELSNTTMAYLRRVYGAGANGF